MTMQQEIEYLRKLDGVEAFLSGDMDYLDLPQATQAALYEHFLPEMPYGVVKARIGDPDQYIAEKLAHQAEQLHGDSDETSH